ncbi:MAG: hypothetical protein PF487_09095 [Bacteroidales bacterium]|jgi:hypothetical protein|nr:hypothetical protein [Bacteroidales bacterium]
MDETIFVLFDGTSFFLGYNDMLKCDPDLEIHGKFTDIHNASDFCDIKNLEL